MVRAEGLPKPQIRWSMNGKPIDEHEHHKIETTATSVEGQVTSTLSLSDFNMADVGIVSIHLIFFFYLKQTLLINVRDFA